MAHVRETLLAAIKTRLDGIKGGVGYNYTRTFAGAQRYIHNWDGDEHDVNVISGYPTAIIKPLSETASGQTTVEEFDRRIDIEIEWKTRGNSSCEDINDALEDMEKALFANFDGYGVNATNLEFEVRHVDIETGAPLDGIILVLRLDYRTLVGDPATGP